MMVDIVRGWGSNRRWRVVDDGGWEERRWGSKKKKKEKLRKLTES